MPGDELPCCEQPCQEISQQGRPGEKRNCTGTECESGNFAWISQILGGNRQENLAPAQETHLGFIKLEADLTEQGCRK